MNILRPGTIAPWRLPLFDDAAEGGAAGGGAAAGGQPGAGASGSETDQGAVFDPAKAYEGLEPDNLAWLQKNETLFKDPAALAKHSFNQEKLLGNAVRVPADDASPEEREAFLNKLGRPKDASGYKLEVPKDMPEGLPYDGEFAKAVAAKAHELGLTQSQMAGLHDLFIGYQVDAFKTATQRQQTAIQERATKATAELEKLWGPLNSETAAANLEIADKVFTSTKGGQEFLAALKEIGLVGPNKEILDARIAPFIAEIGTALYTEDGVLRGRADEVGNPFAEGSDSFNLTKAMQIVKENPDRARSLIAAAGKKPADFGLQAA